MDEHEALSSLEVFCMGLEHARLYSPHNYEVFKSTHEALKLVLPLAKKQLLADTCVSIIDKAKHDSNNKEWGHEIKD